MFRCAFFFFVNVLHSQVNIFNKSQYIRMVDDATFWCCIFTSNTVWFLVRLFELRILTKVHQPKTKHHIYIYIVHCCQSAHAQNAQNINFIENYITTMAQESTVQVCMFLCGFLRLPFFISSSSPFALTLSLSL